MELKSILSQCIPKLEFLPHLQNRCSFIVDHMDEPWGHPTLRSIMNNERKVADRTDTALLEEGRSNKIQRIVENT